MPSPQRLPSSAMDSALPHPGPRDRHPRPQRQATPRGRRFSAGAQPPAFPRARSAALALALGLALALMPLLTGCRVVQGAAEMPAQAVRAVTPGATDRSGPDAIEVQQILLRVADDFGTSIPLAVDGLRRGPETLPAREMLQWKISIASATTTIVSGPNATANLLDLTVFITVTRAAIEDHWLPKVFGESARPLLESCRQSETNVWRLTSRVLRPEQQAELRRAIETWQRENPRPETVLSARALGFTSRITAPGADETPRLGSVFSLLNVDPLAGMDPAVREITQTRLFAERALFIAQKMPTLVRWQADLLAVEAADLPAVRQMVTNSTAISESVARFAAVAEKLPGQVSAEREAILKALESQEKALSPLVAEVRQTLATGSQMSASLNTTLVTFDALMKRFGVGEPKPPGSEPAHSEPFRIQDYGQAAAKLEAAAERLTELLRTLDRTLGSTNLAQLTTQVAPAVQQAQASGQAVVDHAFARACLLVGVILAAALLYQVIARRLRRTH